MFELLREVVRWTVPVFVVTTMLKLGGREDHLRDIGLGTAQRNTAAALLIAAQNFRDPDVLVMVTVANTLGLVMLLLIARWISRDNVRRLVEA